MSAQKRKTKQNKKTNHISLTLDDRIHSSMRGRAREKIYPFRITVNRIEELLKNTWSVCVRVFACAGTCSRVTATSMNKSHLFFALVYEKRAQQTSKPSKQKKVTVYQCERCQFRWNNLCKWNLTHTEFMVAATAAAAAAAACFRLCAFFDSMSV